MQEGSEKIFVWLPTIGNDSGSPLENRFHPVEIFFVQLGMEGNDGGNGCFYFPTFLHVEQTTKLEQEIFFVGGEGNKVVFLADASYRFSHTYIGFIGFFCRLRFKKTRVSYARFETSPVDKIAVFPGDWMKKHLHTLI